MNFLDNLDKAMEHIKKGAFLTTKNNDTINTMTIGWGYGGIMWKDAYFIAMVRPSRYTYEVLKTAKDFTISIPFDKLKDELVICGTKSGREIKKDEIVNFIPSNKCISPIVENCNLYYECKIAYVQQLDKSFIDEDIDKNIYQDKQYHFMYYGKIIDTYKK